MHEKKIKGRKQMRLVGSTAVGVHRAHGGLFTSAETYRDNLIERKGMLPV